MTAPSPDRRPADAPPPPFAFAALLGSNAMLACGPLLVRLADTGPIAAGFWRLGLALPILLLLALRERRGGGPLPTRGVLAMVVLGGLFFAADLASWHLGIVQTKLANAALFGNASSLVLPLAGIAITGIWPGRLQWVALGAALAGALLLMGGSYRLSPEHVVGDLLCLLAGLFYAAYLLSIQSARRTLRGWTILALSTAASVGPMLIAALIAGERVMPIDWRPVVVLAFTSQLVGQGLMVYAIAYFSPLVVGLALLVQPAVAAVLGWASFGEALSPTDMAGACIIAAALVLVRLPGRKTPPQPGDDAVEVRP